MDTGGEMAKRSTDNGTTKHFNELTPAEAERLALLAEECAEVIHIVGKILRHGLDGHNPFDPKAQTNRSLLQKELGHVIAAIRLLSEDDLRLAAIEEFASRKLMTVGEYLHHARVPDVMERGARRFLDLLNGTKP